MNLAVTATANAVTGRFRKKIQRQLAMSSRTPPIRGPAALPMPAAPRIRPPASPAFSAGRAAKVIPRIAGHISAPPTPISTRAAISHASLCATAAGERHRGEDRGADEEDALAPEQVGQAPAGDDQDAEGERVCVHHPLRGVDGGVEVLLDRGDDDVDRGEVVGDDEDRDRHRDQRQPGAAVDLLLLGHSARTLPRGGRRRRRLGRLAAWPTPPPLRFAAPSRARFPTAPSRCASGMETPWSPPGTGRR